VVEVEWLIPWINPKARHLVNLVTPPDIFLPIRPGQVDAAKRNQKAGSVLPAFSRQPRVDPIHIFGEQRFEAARPGLDEAVLLELCDQRFRIAILQCPKRPVEEIYVGVDDSAHRRIGGVGGRRLRRE